MSLQLRQLRPRQ